MEAYGKWPRRHNSISLLCYPPGMELGGGDRRRQFGYSEATALVLRAKGRVSETALVL